MPNMQKRRVGRPDSTRLAEDIAALCLLSRPNASISASDLATLLTIDKSRAHEILAMLASAAIHTSESFAAPLVPLLEQDEFGTQRRIGTSNTGKAWTLRLTRPQAEALSRALDLVGVSSAEPLRKSVMKAFAPVGYSDKTYERELETGALPVLLCCAESLAHAQRQDSATLKQPAIMFLYQTDKTPRPLPRRVIPQQIYIENDLWHIRAYDLDAKAVRIFSVMRMQDIKMETRLSVAPSSLSETGNCELVRLTCATDAAESVLKWEGARFVGKKQGITYIDIPYYQGDWLARRILSMAGKVSCTHKLVNETIQAIIEEDLSVISTHSMN